MSIGFNYDGGPFPYDVAPTSLTLASGAELGSPVFGGMLVEDPTAALAMKGHRPFIVTESACSQPRLFTGWTTERSSGRSYESGQIAGTTARAHDLTIVDLNALFGFRMISGADGNRPAETFAARMAWILGSSYLTGLIADTGYIVSNTTTIDAADYREGYPTAVLNDLMDRSGGAYNFFAFWDPVAAAVGLWVGHLDDAVSTSTLRVSNVPADVDSTVTFAPDAEAKVTVSPTDTYSEVTVKYAHGTKRLFRSRASTATNYIRRGTTIDRPYTGSASTARTQAERFLDQHANEQDRITVTIIVPAAAAGLAVAGQRMDVKFSHLTGYTTFTSMRIVNTSLTPTNDHATHYALTLELAAPRPAGTGCSIMGLNAAGTTYDVPISDTPTGFYPYLSSLGYTGNDYVYGLPGGWAAYGGTSLSGSTPLRPRPNSTGTVYAGGWTFREYGLVAADMPLGYCDDGDPTLDHAAKVWLLVVGPGEAKVWLHNTTGIADGSVSLYRIDMPAPANPALDVWTLISTAALTFPSTVVTVPDDGYCLHAIRLGETTAAQSWGYGGFTWSTDIEISLPTPPAVTAILDQINNLEYLGDIPLGLPEL